MPSLNILQEILTWSKNRPPWQRDALRRLVCEGDLVRDDIEELAQISRHTHGLVDSSTSIPLAAQHIPAAQTDSVDVRLLSLTHNVGVNALAERQTITFGEGMTVVYGANAAGKSGYTRILKKLCRARGAEEILANVVSGARPSIPSASITYRADHDEAQIDWDDSAPTRRVLSKVSVFDRHCASVYLTRQTDVAYRPFGLDLFDKLSNACEDVRKILEKERNRLAAQQFQFPSIPEGTAVHKLISSLTALTNVPSAMQLSTLTDADRTRLRHLQTTVRDLESDDPRKTARALELRANRGVVLVARLESASMILGGSLIAKAFAARDVMQEHRERAQELRQTAFGNQPLAMTGSDTWEALWRAARDFSVRDAYSDRAFPAVDHGSLCVLCQQQLGPGARERFERYETFYRSQLQNEHDQAARNLERALTRLRDCIVADDIARSALDELQIDQPGLADAVDASLSRAEKLRQTALEALESGGAAPDSPGDDGRDKASLESHFEMMHERVDVLRKGGHDTLIRELRAEMMELEARQVLEANIQVVLDEIERRKRLAVYQQCIEETKTTAITRKSTDLTKRSVTEKLTRSFLKELDALRFRHVEVRMVAARGSRGLLLHKIELTRAPSMEVTKVVSEGEARCLSIASFFAELSTADHDSAILFDDPVSSLDHNWRKNVAARLVAECARRQVIVFTHDIVFLLALEERAKSQGVDFQNQYVRRSGGYAGVSDARLPWVAMNVGKRLGRLREMVQTAEAMHRKGLVDDYEREAGNIYGYLREAWERGAEEILLAGTVERYRSSVQTLRARDLADITDQDCSDLHDGMTRCSTWMTGHDQAPADNSPLPEPTDIRQDVEQLAEWVKRIRERRR